MFEVYQYLGKKYMPGQGDVEVTWSWLCKDIQTGNMVILKESKDWGYCSPNLSQLKADILEGNSSASYFYCSKKEVKNCIGCFDTRKSCKHCEDLELCKTIYNKEKTVIATLEQPITANMVKNQGFSL